MEARGGRIKLTPPSFSWTSRHMPSHSPVKPHDKHIVKYIYAYNNNFKTSSSKNKVHVLHHKRHLCYQQLTTPCSYWYWS